MNKQVAATFLDFLISRGHLGKNSVLTHLWFSDFGKILCSSSGHPVIQKPAHRPFVGICPGLLYLFSQIDWSNYYMRLCVGCMLIFVMPIVVSYLIFYKAT